MPEHGGRLDLLAQHITMRRELERYRPVQLDQHQSSLGPDLSSGSGQGTLTCRFGEWEERLADQLDWGDGLGLGRVQ